MGVTLLLLAALGGQGYCGRLQHRRLVKGGPYGHPTHQALPQGGCRHDRDGGAQIGRGRRGSELMGVVLESGLPDVAGLGGGARRPGRTDALVAKVLAVELRDGDPPAGVQVFALVVRALLPRRRRRRPRFPFAAHLVWGTTVPRPRPSQPKGDAR